MLTSVVTSSFPSLILLSLCENTNKHKQPRCREAVGFRQEEKSGNVLESTSVNIGYSSEEVDFFMSWSGGYTLMQPVTWFPISCTHRSFSHFRELWRFLEHTFGAVALQTGTRNVLSCSFVSDVCMSLVQPLHILPPEHCSGSAVTRWCAGGPLLGGIGARTPVPFPNPLPISFWGFSQATVLGIFISKTG